MIVQTWFIILTGLFYWILGSIVLTIVYIFSGTFGYIGTSIFVRKIYSTVKID